MNAVERERMVTEAKLQLKALNKISKWRLGALAFSSIGVALTYAGIAGENRNLYLGIPGIIFIISGMVLALLLNLGLRNGRRNVEKILNMADGKGYEV